VEDQQPAAGDLTDVTESGDVTESADAESDDAAETDGTVDSESGDESVDGATEPDDSAGGFRQRRPAGTWSVFVAAVAALLFVCSAAFAAASVQPYLVDRANVDIKQEVARTAANAITTLWTYNPTNIDKLADRASQYLSGDFEAAYRKYIDAIAAPNKQAQITNNTQVTGAAVESLQGSDATAIVYTNTTSISPATKDIPSLKYLSYRLVMQRQHAHWLVTKMTTVTSLDLTPKF
jgi:Mce-associated membrane protein